MAFRTSVTEITDPALITEGGATLLAVDQVVLVIGLTAPLTEAALSHELLLMQPGG